ncbi:hypothetical protein APHAL10511_000303 [Amanita phalloides]|nr:hypothetical protein APHAL10511_000303 [Amanita phalloides]
MPPDTRDISPERSQTGGIVPDRDASGLTRPDYSRGVLYHLCSPFFAELRDQLGPFLVDKTALIERIVKNGLNAQVHLVLRPRRCGKTTMLQMLKSFFFIRPNNDHYQLFQGLYIAKSNDLCQEHMGKYAVLYLDMKNIVGISWKRMFRSFRKQVSNLYEEWHEYLLDSLTPKQRQYFESIRLNEADEEEWDDSLTELCGYLARKSKQKVMVFIDEYEVPNNCAHEKGFFEITNYFFGRQVLPPLLKTNPNLKYAILAGVTPTTKSGWYSGLNNTETHALYTKSSIFSGMLMFTEAEVTSLRRLSGSELDPADLKAHYNSYSADGISVYNPVSIMGALKRTKIENFWVTTGTFPLLRRNILEDFKVLETVVTLLSGTEVSLQLKDDVTFSRATLSQAEILTLLYYAGYLTMTTGDKCKIPNREVMADWATCITGDAGITRSSDIDANILDVCVGGPVNSFAERWPQFMQDTLDPKLVAKERGAKSRKTLERIYQAYLFGLFHFLYSKGWESTIESRAGNGYINIRIVSKTLRSAVLIELKSSKDKQGMEKDSLAALDQILMNNYRNPVGLPEVHIIREYGIATYHLESCVKGRYLELDSQKTWVEKEDPAMDI